MKLIIHGYPHSGTTLLQRIISSIDSVHNIDNETHLITDKMIQDAQNKHVLIKHPFSLTTFFLPEYDDYVKIWIIRNPYYIYSSINKRFKNKIPENHNITRCLNTIYNFMYFKNINKPKNTFYIKYEEMFDNNFLIIRNMLDTLGISYNNDIFINKEDNVYKQIPSDSDYLNKEYRKWQVQQTYEYKDVNRPVYLTKTQIDILDNSPYMKNIGYTRPATVHIID